MKNMIEVNHIHISLGKKKVLNDLTFHVEEQEIFGFLGPSGAGKTTTIKILTGQLLAGEGDFFVDASKDEIGILSDNTGAYERLTVYRNVLFFAELANVPKKAVSDVLKKVKLKLPKLPHVMYSLKLQNLLRKLYNNLTDLISADTSLPLIRRWPKVCNNMLWK